MKVYLKDIIRVEDIFRDKTTFQRTLEKGEGTCSPYSDSWVSIKVKIEVDGKVIFDHGGWDNLGEIEDKSLQKY
jgi:hypothetical protein